MAKEKKQRMADKADKHDLYEQAVQDVETEIDFVAETWKELRPRPATKLREDFCGTAATSCEWIRRGPDNEAWSVDIDPDVLAWGREHRVGKLTPEQQQRIHLVESDVMTSQVPQVDIVLAMNFSYWMFKRRGHLRDYFKRVRDGLAQDGMLMLDAFGGYEAYRDELEEERECEGFTYVWHHESYDPLSGDMDTRIDFKFPDGSVMKRAFTYHWRLWSLPELREILDEAGFSRVTVYMQGWDDDDEEDGDFQPVTRAEADAGWLAYIVAEK